MVTHGSTVEIKAPVEKVFAFITDFRRYHEWQDGIIESSQMPDGPTQLGTKFKNVRTFVGQRLDVTGEVTEFVPNKKFAVKSTSGPIKFNLSQTFEPVAAGTKTTIQVEMEAGGFFKLAEGALAGNLKKEFDAQAEKLKALLEA